MQIQRSPTVYVVCIVGSGAGGGMAAKVLTEAGADVVMLEAGVMWDTARDSKMYAWSYDSRYLWTRGSRAFSTNGVGGTDPGVWEVVPPRAVYVLPEEVRVLSCRADGQQLAAYSTIWDTVRQGNTIVLRRSPLEVPGSFALFCDGGSLWARSESYRFKKKPPTNPGIKDHPLELWQVAPERRHLSWWPEGEDENEADALGFSKDGKHLLAFRSRWPDVVFGIELWDLQAEKLVAKWPVPNLTSVYGQPVFSRDGKLVAVGGDLSVSVQHVDPTLFIWRVPEGELIARLQQGSEEYREFFKPKEGGRVPQGPMRAIAFSADGAKVFVGLTEGVGIVHVKSGTLHDYWQEPGETRTAQELVHVSSLALTPDGGMLATGSNKGTICLRETSTGHLFGRWRAHDAPVTALTFSPDGNTLVSGSRNGEIKLWSIPFIRENLTALGFEW